ncbi:agmatine deiminase family protein [Marinibactrum halimedae]|uniref:Agmatine deiminase n=1 Tax=Marinibactrum halimedae TaxID=1444977 RepID=A0AA37TDP8_9GAMM|nr:agmatine deiminase family protein [Marinibactrum halimedae]MCD9460576.1 agmatine deiminase family protein [Marinibactrum halimedae]GLS27207.1 agmatine deiminase [Marinibactrum halimedae]
MPNDSNFASKTRLPAEWEPQDAVMVTWPHANSDWAPWLNQVEDLYEGLVKLLSQYVNVLVVSPPETHLDIAERLVEGGADQERVFMQPIATNDTWARDHGPITVYVGRTVQIMDYRFNGWGNKFAAHLDNKITVSLYDAESFPGAYYLARNLVLEGGAIESDGQGVLMTTTECLLNENRNPRLTKTEIEEHLLSDFGAQKILWLEHGYLSGDDTDSHIDTLARFCPNNTIAYVKCDDPEDEHYDALSAMEAQLHTFTNAQGEPYRLLPLPWPEAKFDANGERLPATYANFLITNNAVLMPTYNDKQDALALNLLQEAFPDRDVHGVDCSVLIEQHGSLHCITMQIPKGALD